MSESTNESCQIFGIAGVVTQLVLGFLSFSVLVIKRYRQKPKRPWRIWALDASKQAVSQMIAHFINVAISIGLSYKLQNDACIWYAATNILDNTCGVFICVGVLRLLEHYLLTGKLDKYQSGNYYQIYDEYDQQKASQIYSSGSQQMEHEMHSLEITVVKKRIIIEYATWFIQFLMNMCGIFRVNCIF